mmetsp:Transcript_2450/g.4185  ORF Transcript_2450/g.4185 Transcript_2450/m.4185 type:complete len:141 (-) Transcript_2450:36-458(-)
MPAWTVGEGFALSPPCRPKSLVTDAIHIAPAWPLRRVRGAAMGSFLDAGDQSAAADADAATVEGEAAEVLREARAAQTMAKRAVRFAWGAVFICGIATTLDIGGASLDFRAAQRSKEALDEEEANLEATGWPRWLHQTDA